MIVLRVLIQLFCNAILEVGGKKRSLTARDDRQCNHVRAFGDLVVIQRESADCRSHRLTPSCLHVCEFTTKLERLECLWILWSTEHLGMNDKWCGTINDVPATPVCQIDQPGIGFCRNEDTMNTMFGIGSLFHAEIPVSKSI